MGRHTRSLCDWSSDVCSSDLVKPPAAVVQVPELVTVLALLALPFHVPTLLTVAPPVLLGRLPVQVDRKSVGVGKECRSRWSSAHYKTMLGTVCELVRVSCRST